MRNLTRKISERLTECDKDLSRILLELEEIVGKTPSPKSHTRRNLVKLGFTKNEAKAWREHEPNFTRRIFTDLDNRRRLDRACMQHLYILVRCCSFRRTVMCHEKMGKNPVICACSCADRGRSKGRDGPSLEVV